MKVINVSVGVLNDRDMWKNRTKVDDHKYLGGKEKKKRRRG